MKKRYKILIGIGVISLILGIVLLFSLGPIIKTAVNTAGPKLAGVPVQLEHADVNLFTGKVRIKGLLIGNPEGFHTASAMEINDFMLKIKMTSLFSKTILIKEILIDSPQITYEKSLKSSNLSQLQKNLASKPETPAETPAEPSTEKKSESSKKVIIEDFQLNGATIHLSITALGGKKMTLPLPSVHMKDIGKDSDGASPAKVIEEIFGSISDAVVKAVSAMGDVSLKGISDAGKGVTDAAKGAKDSIKKGLGDLFGK